ncbi:hypothetical protein S40285_00770 [Stachybotrys chlorohalonatus IBT 40285]|uniref:Carboxylic ester hydrolase n=1 Tax=Stachybotrys chlorohalonatus (strain IBT 40285) TaxID=1283841 RepID=A0A084QR98_STAC4|nr:hypothetical protein S40285_00770 [Stachybotrys chlorohalonata IBT 40285]
MALGAARRSHRRRNRRGSNLEFPDLLGKAPVRRKTRRRCLPLFVAVSAVAVFVLLFSGLFYGLQRMVGLPSIHPSTSLKSSTCHAEDDSGPEVDLGYATYRGNYLDNGISEFLGMRFAEPPLGDLRWRAPVEPQLAEGVQRAKQFGPLCLGISTDPNRSFDEDCLFVNVWGPTNATADMKLPVLVFIQGGGYTVLANGNWNGTELVNTADRDMVFVNFNYRVGLWGFLAGEEVRQDGALNAGLLDQRFVLQWFGGDPDHVVIQGISAGAGSVALHLASYGGQDHGLFVGAIAESIFFPSQPYVSDLEYQYERTMLAAGCAAAADRMKCLRAKSMRSLQRINRPSPFPSQTIDPLFYWTPCIDGEFLQDLPYVLYETGRFIKVPLLTGACTNGKQILIHTSRSLPSAHSHPSIEGSVFAPSRAETPEHFIDFLRINYPGITLDAAQDILDLYPLEPRIRNHGLWFPSSARAYGDATFICPVNNILQSYVSAFNRSVAATTTDSTASPPATAHPSRLWSYRYHVLDRGITDNGLGVPHVFEAPAVFGPGMLPPQAVASSYWTYNARVIPQVMRYWLSFVRTLDPNTLKDAEAPTWEPWGFDRRRLVIKVVDSSMETTGDADMRRCDYWKGIADLTRQ